MLCYSGKVRDVYSVQSCGRDDRLRIVSTDRISCFNSNIGTIPGRGVLINQISKHMFWLTKDLVPNHVDPETWDEPVTNEMRVIKCDPIRVEFVVRAYITGSLWNAYSRGERTICGVVFPDGLQKNQKLDHVVITPTTKSATDDPISATEIVQTGLMSQEELDQTYEYAIKLFNFGTELADRLGYILVDTKMEFGRAANGKILVIDELLTCDCSRYWRKGTETMDVPESFDKDIVRNWARQSGPNSVLPEQVKTQVIQAYQMFLDRLRIESGCL